MADLTTVKGRLGHARKLKEQRGNWEINWQEMAEFLWPAQADFTRKTSNGTRKRNRVYDDDPRRAADNFVAGMFGAMVPQHATWGGITVEDEDMARFPAHAQWLSTVSRLIISSFGPGRSSFYAQIPSMFRGVGCLGTGPFFTDLDRATGRWIDQGVPLSEVLIERDHTGQVFRFFRFFCWPLAKAERKWGRNALSERSRGKLAAGKDTEEVEFLHSVYPNPDFEEARIGPRGFEFTSRYDEVEAAADVSVGGYHTMPLVAPAWEQAPGEEYGRGIGHNALSDIRALQVMKRDFLTTGNFQARPVNLAADDDNMDPVHMTPGVTIFGAVNAATGRPLIQQYAPSGNLVITQEALQQQREAIRDAFFFTLMQLVGRTGMTATEVLERQEEKLRLIGPHVGNIEASGLSGIILRRYDIMSRNGMLPPPPPSLEGVIKVSYDSPMAKILKSADGAAIVRSVGTAATWAQQTGNTDIMDNYDLDRAVVEMNDAFAAPPSIIRDPRVVQAMREQRAQMQQLQQAAQLGEQGAGIVQKLKAASGAA